MKGNRQCERQGENSQDGTMSMFPVEREETYIFADSIRLTSLWSKESAAGIPKGLCET